MDRPSGRIRKPFYVSLAAIILLVLVSVFMTGAVKSIALIFVLIFIFWMAISYSYDILIYFSISLTPLTGILRWDDLGNFVSASFVSLVYFFLVIVLFLRVVSSGCLNIPRKGRNVFLANLFLIIVLVIGCVAQIHDPVFFALTFREFVLPAILFFACYSLIKNDKQKIYYVIYSIFITSGLVATLNLAHYFYGLSIVIDNRVMALGGEGTAVYRSVFGFDIYRLQHILGLSTQGAGGTFYTIMSSLGLLLVSHVKSSLHKLLICSFSLILFFAALLIVSLSTVVTLIIVVVARYYWVCQKRKKIGGFLGLVFLMLPISFLLLFNLEVTAGGVKLNILDYAYESFISKAIDLVTNLDFYDFLFGFGLIAKGGSGLTGVIYTADVSSFVIDRWVFVALFQLGFMGFSIMIFSWLFNIIKSASISCNDQCDVLGYKACFIVFLACYGFSHGAAIIDNLFSPIYFLCAGVLAGLRTYTQDKFSFDCETSLAHKETQKNSS